MMAFEITPEEQAELDKALYDALNPLASAIRSRQTGLPADRMWEADPIEVTLSVLAAWKVMDAEVRQLTARAAATAGSYGASYEQMGAVWGITRQGARKKWPDAVSRSAPATARRNTLALFGGTAELVQVSSGDWSWTGVGADGASAAVTDGTRHATAEEAAAHAGAFLKEHSLDAPDHS
ncbi:hypothetical protein EDD90_10538 [Streptomyces sp. Ag109_O5-1]|uniref:hypothetical protein n=1 Tax=Streptomyces sp. Ag109_O5-1 TaxID=1938851 RepID=UPI000F506999|nr:hypothetical protein [Streptomyces sp. Ag109_O5-1]RPE47104.1 hypothetical protein EDD90_10538 [Streptomyces sp. Ag109_O5-1]